MTEVGYFSNTEAIVKASWSNIQQDGVAAFKLSDRTLLPPTLTENDLPERQTQVLNVHPRNRINHYPAKSDEASAPESIFDTKNWLNWNGDLDNLTESKDNWEADDESDIELANGIEDVACSE
jgi:hypothetical protein